MIVKKPSIFIYTHLADEAILREVCAGVEEEGVFYEITEFPDECMEKLSYKAARDSMLGSGIGIFGTAVCLKMRGLEKGAISRHICLRQKSSAEKWEQTVPVRLKNSPLNSENVPGKEMCK